MFGKLFLVFAVLPILEIFVLLNVSDQIGGWNTFGLVILSAFFGAYFVRKEGVHTIAVVQQKMAEGQMPGKEMSEGLLLLVAGVLLVTPGFITDVMGLLFTLPFTRAPIASYLLKSFMLSKHANVHFTTNAHGASPFSSAQNDKNHNGQGDVFDAEYTDKSDSDANTDHNNDTQNRLN